MRRYYLVIVLLFIMTLCSATVYTQDTPEVSRIDGTIVYDLYDNSGIVSLNFTFTQPLSNATVNLTLFSNNIVSIINVTDGNGNPLMYSYYASDHVVSVLIANKTVDKVVVTYMIEDLFDELSVNTYAGIIDLTVYTGYTINIQLTFLGKYNVSTEPSATFTIEDEATTLKLDQPALYSISLYKFPSIVETTPTTPATTSTTTAPQTTPTTTPATTPTSTTIPQTTSTTSTSTPTETKTTTTPKPGEGYMTTLAIIVIVIIIIAVIALILYKRR